MPFGQRKVACRPSMSKKEQEEQEKIAFMRSVVVINKLLVIFEYLIDKLPQ